jgi:hypothetical protein
MVGLFAVLGHHLAWSQPGRVATPPPLELQRQNAACMIHWLESQLHVRERTGRNDGPEIEAYLRTTGNAPGSEWCGACQATGNRHCGLPIPAGAGGSYNWFKASDPRTFFLRGTRGSADDIQPGHKVGFYRPALKRIGHIGCAVERTKNGFITIEGNTGRGIGAGVHRLSRSKGEIYAASNWLY